MDRFWIICRNLVSYLGFNCEFSTSFPILSSSSPNRSSEPFSWLFGLLPSADINLSLPNGAYHSGKSMLQRPQPSLEQDLRWDVWCSTWQGSDTAAASRHGHTEARTAINQRRASIPLLMLLGAGSCAPDFGLTRDKAQHCSGALEEMNRAASAANPSQCT